MLAGGRGRGRGTSRRGTEPNHTEDLKKEFLKLMVAKGEGVGGWETQMQGSGRYGLPVME